MKIFYQFLLLVLFSCSTHTLDAQQKEIPVRFANGDFVTGSNISKSSFTTASIQEALFNGDYYVLVQFAVLPPVSVKQKMKDAGVQLGTYLPGNAYLAVIKNSFDFSRARSFHINSINPLPAGYKIHRQLQGYQPATDKEQVQAIAVTYFEQVAKAMVLEELKKAGAIIVTEKYAAASIILIQYNKSLVEPLAAMPFVSSISLQLVKDQLLNYNSRAAHAVSGLNALNGKNLNGKGVTVGVGDNSDISTHIDFSGRLINRSPWVPADHGTHTSGTMAGAGIINPKNRGVAAQSTIVNQYFSDIIVNTPSYISDYNLVVTNNSYHSANNGCAGQGEYNVLSNYGDNQILNNGQLQHVFASGNDGSLTCNAFPPAFGTVKSGWQTGKNILTVGAVRVDNYSIASYSSRGPSTDGRIKPEITADGYAVLSTNRFNTYGNNFGTSMAAPAVTGGLALMYERWRQLHGGANPKNALMKALACNTAEDLGNPGPDFTFGFGMLNVRRAVEAIDSSRYFISSIADAGSNTHNFVIPPNTRRVKIMLYWNDVPAASNAATALVNDLDLVVIEPSFTLHRPMSLNTIPSFVNEVATEAPDHLNNIEQVVIENPGPGIYSANINGYSIPQGPQEYVVTYEIIKNAVTVEYPFGGETLVPGETENIRWTAYGNETDNFTIEYSSNNGSNWTTVDNNVPATSRIYNWTVPAAATNNALIKISRNNSPFTDQSNFNFVVLGQPIDTATTVCEGAVQLKWSAVAGATSYDILQLSGDSMKVIGNTTASPFLITGLDKRKRYWFATAAKNNSVSGRRSIAVSALPATGACSLAAFNNDLKIDSILEPTTARQLFSNAANATKPVKVLIKNLGTVAVSGPYNVSFDYGGTIVTETVNSTINAGGSFTYTFTGTYPVIPAGYQYQFKAWVTKSTDTNHQNDTAYKTVKYINNDPIATLPLQEGFESMPAAEFNTRDMAIGGNKYLDFSADSSIGRARTFVNSGFALSGNRALTLDQAPYSINRSIADSATFNYNLSLFAAKQLRFEFFYKNHGQSNEPGNKVWIRGSENDPWLQAFDLYDNQAALGDWKKAIIIVNDVLNSANPPQAITATFQVKLGQEGYTSANSPYPVVDIDDGYTFDNIVLNEAINDVAVLAINSPDKSGCGLSSSNPVSIRLKNYNNAVLNNLQVSYQVNGGPIIMETIPSIAANQSLDYVFTQRVDLSAFIEYSFNVWVKYATDSYASNDSILNYAVHNSPVINSYPYLQSFETDDGYFYTTGTNSTWQWGSPVKDIINKAASGTKIWTTNLNGNYTDNETSYLVSPCFDLTGLKKPVLAFSHIYDIELDYDYTWVEYTTDGKTWMKLGNAGDGTNWHDNAALNNWRYSDTKWHVASIDIPVTNTSIHFRFVMSSDGGVTQEGIGIDDIRVYEKTDIATGHSTPAVLSKPVSGNNWVPFNWGDSVNGPWYVLAEINPNGQNLGTVTTQAFLNTTGVVRSSNNQYYTDRNYVLTSTNNPTGNISIRLYFTDAEANAIINSSECPGCENPQDAYELGIVKYKGSMAEENGTLEDNFSGLYQFILPANTQILPHGNGYYAEFTVNSLSEFWFSKGDIKPAVVNACADLQTFSTTAGAASYQWQVNDGNGYTDIINNVYYSGGQTNTLTLTNVPTSFTGYKYRCVVNGTARLENTLRFKNIWTGDSGSNWFDASNWSCGTIPDEFTDVIITGEVLNNPILSANTAVRSIRILTGVPLTVNTGVSLEVKGR
jgi:hypothetical protein